MEMYPRRVRIWESFDNTQWLSRLARSDLVAYILARIKYMYIYFG